MKYCRYCASCICGDVYYCTEKDKVLKSVNNSTSCKMFVMSELGDVDTGKPYMPKKPKDYTIQYHQEKLF